MTIQSEINRIKQNIADCYTTLTAKGATIPATENVDNLAACIRSIPTTPPAFETQSGDTIITSAGTPLALDGISSLTSAPSVTDSLLTFADDGNDTVSFSMQDLKEYVNPVQQVGRFVAVGEGYNISYSDDGVNWTEVPISIRCSGVGFGNGKFIATQYGNSSNKIAYSDDGINWTVDNFTSGSFYYNVAYGNNTWVMVGESKMFYSTDNGSTWTSISGLSGRTIIFANNMFVAGRAYSGTMKYSTDGVNWYNGTGSGISKSTWGIAYGNGKFVATLYDSSTVAYSSNGIDWSTSTLPSRSSWVVASDGSKFVAVSENGSAISTDGINWTSGTLPISTSWYGMTYNDGRFIAVGYGNTFISSTDGINWTQLTTTTSTLWHDVAYGLITPQQ